MNRIDFNIFSILQDIFNAMSKLKKLGVIRSQKLLSDYAEWLVSQIYEGQLSKNKNQEGWDVEADNKKIQVKAHAKSTDNINRWSSIDPKKIKFDILVIIVCSENFSVTEIYEINKEEINRNKSKIKNKRLNWNDFSKCRLSKREIKNYDKLSYLFDLRET